ncbi:hypothetical protein KC717_02700 [Candidatus Dojkabacteria bacterium]|uniref:Hydroxyacid dehydrogenase n=1 Tax=Candidatus Dojkabacteria bacterium TaxID=2099670 RepID=A0A955L7M4_9BACT|nr:hypothetical protein [Candidatus Dojkabacteria bacterium]
MNTHIPHPEQLHPDALQLLKEHNFSIIEGGDGYNAEIVISPVSHSMTCDEVEKYPNLKYIVRTGVGTDNIDGIICGERSIEIINAPGSNAFAVAEYVVTMMLTLSRNIHLLSGELWKGGWRQPEFIGNDLKDNIVGLIGFGAIGQHLAKLLLSVGVERIVYYDKHLDDDPQIDERIVRLNLNEVLATAKLISIQIPLLPETKGFLSMKEFELMQKGSYLVNVSRGGVVNEDDLLTALNETILMGAAVDVFENEPNPRRDLIDHPKTICTPHVAGYSQSSQREMSMAPIRELIKRTESLDV